ncbi:multiple sugar transport system ATP-binding protein [Cohaesibacter marisflavi]|uniref:Multiple sugar transport system ATP-binding protein n=1 Tax=Cohaesibacter marisflavi TaxID=655353 RepID=A0A1I5L1E2_9HYPH|nr:ABC transporter ATP-binding protein [Cohaesibacter marisflavi]SFO90962.1 multiple sugar transport system ATP-binding protein [Cohaesibacter marisflavi]
MIQLKSLTRIFDDKPVLDAINLEIPEGSFTSLLGPSGCGKSTLLRILAGLDQPSAGTLLFDGEDVREKSATLRNIAMVFQSYALYPHMTVRANIGLPLAMRSMSRLERLPLVTALLPSARRKRAANGREVERIAAMLGLTELLERKPSELSGGQKQRVAVGRALVRDPKAFLFDEPLSNLDTKLRGQMREEISLLHKQTGKTFIYVTHDQTEAMSLSDQVAVMMEGHILQVAPPRILYSRPANTKVAAFVGEHPINLLTVKPVGTALQSPFGAFVLSEAWDGDIILGLRPENIALVENGPLQGRVTRVDYLGGHTLLDVELSEGICLRVADEEGPLVPAVGNVVQLSIAPQKIHLFKAESGERLPLEVRQRGEAV